MPGLLPAPRGVVVQRARGIIKRRAAPILPPCLSLQAARIGCSQRSSWWTRRTRNNEESQLVSGHIARPRRDWLHHQARHEGRCPAYIPSQLRPSEHPVSDTPQRPPFTQGDVMHSPRLKTIGRMVFLGSVGVQARGGSSGDVGVGGTQTGASNPQLATDQRLPEDATC